MKILVFSPYYPPHIGGLESHSDEFNKHLAQNGADIVVFSPNIPYAESIEEMRYDRVKIIRYPAFEIIPNYPVPKFWKSLFWRQITGLFRSNFDIVISRTRFFLSSFLALVYAKHTKTHWIHIEHGSDFAKFNSPMKTKLGEYYDWTFGRFILRSADRLIANSQASARFVQKLSGRSDCQIIYRGVERQAIEMIKPSAQCYPGKVVITYLGRLIDGKGVIDLLHALMQINADSYHAIIIGDGPELSKLEKFAEENQLTQNISFFGHQPFESTIATLKASDIIINPSYTEGIPTSIIEAALCQKAIIATNVGGTNEIISGNDDGYLIAPKHPDIIAEKLQLLINDLELRKKFGASAFEKVSQKFSWDRAIDSYLEVFSNLLDNRR